MTLTEFLLARIAEDEAAPLEWQRVGGEAGSLAARRLLAECEAKRRQIAHLIRFMEGDYAPWNEEQLQIMATVYADHPDYRDEWKP